MSFAISDYDAMAPLGVMIKGLGAVLLLLAALVAPASAASFTMKRGLNLDIWTTWPAEDKWADRDAILPYPEWRKFLADTDLEALFPSTIGDISLTIESQRGSEALADSEIPQSVLDALATQGKTLDDMSIASGSAFDPDTNTLVFIYAIKVAGADMTALADDFLAVFNDEAPPAEQTPSQVGGKDVIVVRPTADSTDDQLQYIYPKDDVLWVVSAVEPALSEALSKLP